MGRPIVAVYDANVLYPAPLRDLLIRVAQADLVRARWTDAINDEWLRNLIDQNPRLSRERLERTRTLMNNAIRDCLVTGFEDLIPSLTLPDPNDRHVLAAAICAGAEAIVTFNLGDFPNNILAGHDIKARHPDAFVLDLINLDATTVCAAVKRQRESLRNPPKSPVELLDTLAGCGLTQTVARLRTLQDTL